MINNLSEPTLIGLSLFPLPLFEVEIDAVSPPWPTLPNDFLHFGDQLALSHGRRYWIQ